VTLDPNLLTIAAIAVGILGVLATLIAPRLTREARIHAQIFSVDRIRRRTEAGDLRIEIHHGPDLIEDPVFIVRGTVRNIGGKDIVSSHFVDPVAIIGKDEVEILSLEANPPAGVTANVVQIGNGYGITWNILKPRETIKFLAVVKAPDGVTVRGIFRALSIEARLRDVKSDQGFLSGDLRFGFSMALVLMVISIGPISYLGMRNVDAFVYRTDLGLEQILFPSEGVYKSCRVKSGPLYFSECKDVNPTEVAGLIRPLEVRGVRVGISPIATIIAALVSLFYGFTFAFMVRTPEHIRRLMRPYAVDRDRED